jgi:hypothetical protein
VSGKRLVDLATDSDHKFDPDPLSIYKVPGSQMNFLACVSVW